MKFWTFGLLAFSLIPIVSKFEIRERPVIDRASWIRYRRRFCIDRGATRKNSFDCKLAKYANDRKTRFVIFYRLRRRLNEYCWTVGGNERALTARSCTASDTFLVHTYTTQNFVLFSCQINRAYLFRHEKTVADRNARIAKKKKKAITFGDGGCSGNDFPSRILLFTRMMKRRLVSGLCFRRR